MLTLAVVLLSLAPGAADPVAMRAAGPPPRAAAVPADPRAPAAAGAPATGPPASPEALEVAHLLGLDGTAEALRERRPTGPADRDRVMRRVLQASFQVDAAIADVQEEQTALAELTNAIQSDRDARVGVLNVAAGLLAAGAAVGTGMTLRSDTSTAGTWVTTVTSAIGAVLAIYAAAAPNRGTPPLRARTNLLAPFFGRPLVSGRYPQVVWAYLEGAAPGEAAPRKDRLVADWAKLGRVDTGDSPEARKKLDALTRPVPDRGQADADVLQDRQLMLGDVRARIASMKLGLRALLEAVGGDPER